MKRIILALALAQGASYVFAADTASWALWYGTTGTFTQNGTTITVTFTGDSFPGDQRAAIFNSKPRSFTAPPEITNTPGANGTIDMNGGSSVNHFTFSQPVVDPVIALWSVGDFRTPVRFNFLGRDVQFSIISQGAGLWGGGSLVQTGNMVTGIEGNGLLQFKGTYTDISFTAPDSEVHYYGATVGAVPRPDEPTCPICPVCPDYPDSDYPDSDYPESDYPDYEESVEIPISEPSHEIPINEPPQEISISEPPREIPISEPPQEIPKCEPPLVNWWQR